MPTTPEMTPPSKRSSMSCCGEGCTPQEFEISPVLTPASRAAFTAPSICASGPLPANIRSTSPSSGTPSIGAKRRSNSGSSTRPHSNSTSRSRAATSLRKRSRTFAASRPSASQNEAKDANRSVVSTPPQSTSRPRLGATGHRLRALGKLHDALAEALQVRVVGGAGLRALEVALHEHDRLPQRERLVPADVGHRTSRAFLVARDELRAHRKALLARDAVELEHAERRIAAVDPDRAHVAEVCERVPDRRHLPVEDRVQPRGRIEREHRVAEAVVAVDHGRRAALREVRPQPVGDRLDRRDLARLVVLPQPEEALELALEVAGGLAEPLQARGLPVDRVDLDQGIDELFAHPPA